MATVTIEPPARARARRPARVPSWRRARRIALAACFFGLAVAALSWLPAITGSRNLGVTVASVDVPLGPAIAIAGIVVVAGIGVVGFFPLICALVLVVWYLLEGGVRVARRRRGPH
jgi:anti-sigma factor RsiW